MADDLARYAKEHGIKNFLVCFIDLCGVARAKLVPARAIKAAAASGAGFAGFATYLDLSPADPDMFGVPDAEAVIQLPWKTDVAWVPAKLVMGGKPVPQCCRTQLARLTEQAKANGHRLKTGVECEFFLLDPATRNIADLQDTLDKPCYDQQALMRQYRVISRVSEYMETLGWNPYQSDHEDANGQYEMNWEYTDALATADRHLFFKFMLKSVAEEEGMLASFMPKPFGGLTGSGAHVHLSLWNSTGDKNLFEDGKNEDGLSPLAFQFLGGVLEHAPSLAAFSNPTVNSYKRINAPVTLSGATWSPNTVSYGGNNRTHMIRIPDPGRIEVRLPDSAMNPYLVYSALLAAGLDGVNRKANPGEKQIQNAYQHPEAELPKLPATLHDALDRLSADALFRQALGTQLIESYLVVKRAEWRRYMSQVSDWEVKNYL